jgi:hypothetical protein
LVADAVDLIEETLSPSDSFPKEQEFFAVASTEISMGLS